MRLFINKVFLILLLPILIYLILVVLYIKHDHFNDFGIYQNYSWKYRDQSLGDLSTKKLIKNQFNYDSYIMGSSRISGFYACYLQQKIKGSHFFLYGNWNESIGGIYEKMKLIEQQGKPIKNIIIVIDTDFTFEDNGKVKIYDHYLLTHISKVEYLRTHFVNFISNTGNIKLLFGFVPKIESFPNWESDMYTNDVNHKCSKLITDLYGNFKITYNEKKRIDSLINNSNFYDRKSQEKEISSQISTNEVKILYNIKSILDKHKTNYHIVITPLYDQFKFSKNDLSKIQKVFNKNIHDFSGVNEFTESPYNYPDRAHFRDWIAKRIIDSLQ